MAALHRQVPEDESGTELDINPRVLPGEELRDPAVPAAGARRAAAHRAAGRPGRAHPRRQRQAEPGDVRHHVDGARGRAADGRVLTQEHDRQGRVPADRRARAPLREHPRAPVERPARAGGRLLDHRVERGVHARRHGAAVAVARQAPRRGPGHGPAEPRHGQQRPGLLGEVLPVLGRRAQVRAPRPRPLPPGRPRGRRPVRREHDRRRRDHGLDDGRLLRAGGGARRGARRPGGHARRPRRADPRGRRVRRLRRAVPPAGDRVGLPAQAASPRSTPPGTSTAWSTRASAGSSGATRSTCPRT